MNRQQRRQHDRQVEKDNVPYTFSKQEARRVVDEQVQSSLIKIQKQAIASMFAILTIVMHDKYGFGRIRTTRILEACASQYECLSGDFVKMNEILEECKKIGIEIKM